MNIEDMLEINDCPLCDGGALLEEECGCGYYVMQRKERLCFGIPAR